MLCKGFPLLLAPLRITILQGNLWYLLRKIRLTSLSNFQEIAILSLDRITEPGMKIFKRIVTVKAYVRYVYAYKLHYNRLLRCYFECAIQPAEVQVKPI